MKRFAYTVLKGYSSDLAVVAALVIAFLGGYKLLHWLYDLIDGIVNLVLVTSGVVLMGSLLIYTVTKLVLDPTRAENRPPIKTEGK